ncbi:putative ATP-grasp-modified RiPP [Streptomyces sp. NPDC091292]|uniref:putative ATP-grasp-modified RiPP n=1 Tax=Streptomyces sp. NPDC091292 TaxID=3365991 RepID=UPI003807B098
MRPYPEAAPCPDAEVVLDLATQTGRWVGPDGLDVPLTGKHKRSQTCKETKTKTSLDGNKDEGSDQNSDTD